MDLRTADLINKQAENEHNFLKQIITYNFKFLCTHTRINFYNQI